MKKLFAIIGVAALLATAHAGQTFITTTITTNADGSVTSTSVTNTVRPAIANSVWGGIKLALADLKGATNWALVPYASYGVDNHKFGGGALILYNFNNYVGGGIGLDELGSLSMLSANVQLKLPIKPLAFTGWSWATNLVTTPFVYTGLGTPFGGTGNSGVSTHEGEGLAVQFGHLWGGSFAVGAAYIQRQNAGIYSGNYFNPFVGYTHGNSAAFNGGL